MDATGFRDSPGGTPLTGLPAWQAFMRHLSLASGPDVLFLITPDAHGAKVCRRHLRDSLPKHLGPLINLEPDVPNDPAELVTRLESAASRPGSPLFWIELPADVPYESIPDAQAAWDGALAVLNPHRNHLLHDLTGPLVFAGPPWLFQSFRSHAPDWFSVRAGVFDLPRDLEKQLISLMPLYAEDGTQIEPPLDVEIPEFPPESSQLSTQAIEELLKELPQSEAVLLQTLSLLDPAHPIPVWLLATHSDMPGGAGVPETLDALIRRGLLERSLDQLWLRISPAVAAEMLQTLSNDDLRGSLENAFKMLRSAGLGNPEDVRTWRKWNPLAPHAIALCGHAPEGLNSPDLTWLLNQLGLLFLDQGRHAEAEPLLRDALRMARSVYGDEHCDVAVALNNLAQLLKATNRLAEAESLMREALHVDRAAYGNEHPNVARDLNNLGQLLQDTNRLTEAEPLMREALRIDRAAYGDEHPKVAIRLNNLARLLQATNRLAKAEPLMREALRIARAAFGDDHPNVATHLNNLAELLQTTNRLAEAEPLKREALRIDRATYGDEHPDIARDLNNLATLLHATNRLTEAETLMREALRIFHDSLGPEHPRTILAVKNLEAIHAEMGMPEPGADRP